MKITHLRPSTQPWPKKFIQFSSRKFLIRAGALSLALTYLALTGAYSYQQVASAQSTISTKTTQKPISEPIVSKPTLAKVYTTPTSETNNKNGVLDITVVGSGFPVDNQILKSKYTEASQFLMTLEPFKSHATQIKFHFADLGQDFKCELTKGSTFIKCPKDQVVSALTQHGYPVEKIMIISNQGGDYLSTSISEDGTPDSVAAITVGSYDFRAGFAHEFGHLMSLLDEYTTGHSGDPPGGIRGNCWTGTTPPPADAWAAYGYTVNPSEVRKGCTRAEWYRTSSCSLMNEENGPCPYFNGLSQKLISAYMQQFITNATTPAPVPQPTPTPAPVPGNGCSSLGNSVIDGTTGKYVIAESFADCVGADHRIGLVEIHLKSVGSTAECTDRNKTTGTGDGQAVFTGCPVSSDGSPKIYEVSYISRSGYHVKAGSPANVGTQFYVYSSKTPVLRIVMEKDAPAPAAPIVPFYSSSTPATIRNADGRMEAFSRGSNGLVYHSWQTSPSGAWSAWTWQGGGIATSDIIPAQNADGRLEIFSRGADNALYHSWQTTPGGAWSGWYSIGGALAGNPSVARNADGRLEAFARGTNGLVYHSWQTTPGGAWSAWAWSGGGLVTSDIIPAQNADGRLEMFARGADGGLYHSWQLWAGGAWSAWQNLGGVSASNPSITQNADGRLEMFALGTNGLVYHSWQGSPNGTWGAWAVVSGTPGGSD